MWANLIAFACLLGAFATFALALRSERRRRLVRDLPTVPTTAVFIGMVQVEGTAECVAPLSSHVAGRPCVAYAWSVEERWTRQVREWQTDANGKRVEVTRTETGWTPVAGGGARRPFHVRDDAGAIRVDPDGADVQMHGFLSVTCGPHDPHYAFGGSYSVPDSDFIRRVSEEGVALHAPVTVIGHARERTDLIAPETATAFNSLRALRQMVLRGAANVDVQLQRRRDLLPSLATLVTAYAEHERDLHARLAAARAAATRGDEASRRALAPAILALAERYPALQAEASFADLRRQLVEVEQRIALARAYYVDVATAYDTRLAILPDRLIARLAGLRREHAEVDADFERVVERVTFA
jgi:hypothetical protein